MIENNVPEIKSLFNNYPVWFNQQLKELIIEKKCLHAKWKQSNLFKDYLDFKRVRALCLRLSRRLYCEYIDQVESKVRCNTKAFWSFVHKFNSSNSLPDYMYLRDRSADRKRSICNLLAEHFSSVYTNVTLDEVPFSDCNDLLISLQIEECELANALSKLDDNIKSGPDEVPPYFIKRCKQSLFRPLIQLFNKSLSCGIFPDQWKKSFIFPIFKSGDKHNVSNYRPIAIISCIAKIFESIVAQHLCEFIYRSISASQHGFIRGRSVLTNLLLYNDYIFEAFSNKYQVDSVYIDYSKAFDTVNHSLLLRKIYNAGVQGTLYKWIKSYLIGRTYSVRIGGTQSYVFESSSGVPQGSNLGPILFILFINDLPQCLRVCQVLLYADDAKIYCKVPNFASTCAIQQDIDSLQSWSLRNGLNINLDKCHFISFCRGQRNFDSQYSIATHNIQRLEAIRDLGVLYDETLSFDNQIRVVCNKCLRIFGLIRNVTVDFKHVSTLVYLYRALMLPILLYCSSIWHPFTDVAMNMLVAIEHKFLRFASYKTDSPMHFFDHDYTEIRCKLGVISLRSLFRYHDFLLSYKIRNKSFSAEGVHELFMSRELPYNIRNPQPLATRLTRSNYLFESSTHRLRRCWNSLPQSIIDAQSLGQFRTFIRKMLINEN